MREYPIKRKHHIDEEMIHSLMMEIFGNVKRDGNFFISSFGSLDLIKVKLDKGKLIVETKSNPKKEYYTETIAKYNSFIERATGYTAAERKKMITKI